MANFQQSYKILFELEFSGDPKKFLHKNSTEKTITLGGIYRQAHPNAVDWKFVDKIIASCESETINISLESQKEQIKEDMQRASVILYSDEEIRFQVFSFFKNEFWNKCKLDEVHSQRIANRVFSMAVNSGVKTASKLIQKCTGATIDGIIGDITIKTINRMNERELIEKYDNECRKYYDTIVSNEPKLHIYINGWYSRLDRIAKLENDELLFT